MDQNNIQQKLRERNIQATPKLIQELAQAIHEKQEEDRLKQSLQNLDRKIVEQKAAAPQRIPAPGKYASQVPAPQQQFFNLRNQNSQSQPQLDSIN